MSASGAEELPVPPGILLDLWRDACRDLELASSLDTMTTRLREVLPVSLLIVRQLDLTRRRLETIAIGGPGDRRRALSTRQTPIDSHDVGRLLEWVRSGRVTRSVDGRDPIARVLLPGGLTGDVLSGPLAWEGETVGVMLALAGATRWTTAHAARLEQLAEPLTAALRNDITVRQLARHSESLEADKRALLSRLDRQDVADAVVGAETGLRDVIERVDQVAATDTPVLLIGETGSGKEVVARLVHARSRRASGPIVRVNCGAIPAGLVDSELFGHERGSFTGAVNSRQGWFERADGGTLFLDEVAELPLDAQVRLLRILQDGTFDRVGGHKPLTVDVRIVAATHRDLQQMVASGTFREDLWYRLGVFPIWLPPLRDRPEDIPPLAAHFARRAGVRLAGTPLTPTPEDLEALLRYDWPGNVRELAAVIERAAILGDGHLLKIDSALGFPGLPPRTASSPEPALTPPGVASADPASPREHDGRHAPASPPGPAGPRRGSAAPAGSVPLDDAMRAHIESVLASTAGRIEGPLGAAARLHINPHTLRSRMRKLGIDWRQYRRTAPYY